jgi:acetolactate synthase small subunit
MSKPKKDLNLHIDGKKVDVNVTRKDGKVTIELDSEKLDVLLERSERGLNVTVNDASGILGKVLALFSRLRRKR